jgi:exosortase
LWLWLFANLHVEWSINPKYQYGWLVPWLALLLFALRWPTRPARAVSWRSANFTKPLLLAALLPLRVIEEANGDWRLLSWTLALVVVAYSLTIAAEWGGRFWVRHCAFPICFPLVAVPWLVQFENLVVQKLTAVVAAGAVEIAGWIGISALQIGNVIQLPNGFVGVDEACSGVKTLQTAVMLALFLGELFQLRAHRRVLLFLAGCAWVFACNILRATALVVIAATRGFPELTRWHDAVGTLILVLGLAGLFGFAWLLREENRPVHETEPTPAGGTAPSGFTIAALIWLAVVFGSTEFWYRLHEKNLIQRPAWSVRWPESNSSLAALPIPDATRAILRFNEARSARWEEPSGLRWWTFFARWQPERAAQQLVRSHSPEICLPAIGREFEGQLPPVILRAGKTELPFRVYQFKQAGEPLFVFVCVQEDKYLPGAQAADLQDWSARGRLNAAWRGERNLGQRLLELAVLGCDHFPEAQVAAARVVQQIVD